MILKKEIEFYYLSGLFLLAGSCLLFNDFLIPFRDKKSFQGWEITADSKIYFSNPVFFEKANNSIYCFRGGHLYSFNDTDAFSDFYDGNISLVPTSDKWKTPLLSVKGSFFLDETGNSKNQKKHKIFLNEKPSLPVASLLINTADFFSENKGIYVPGEISYTVKSKVFFPFSWNKPANYYSNINDKKQVFFSLYDKSGNLKTSFNAIASVSGKASRSFPQKSVRLSIKKPKEDFKSTALFEDRNEYKSIVLRNGGNDNFKSFFRDMLMQNCLKNKGVITSGFIPCEMYINGEYWGVYIIQNRLDKDFISKRLNVKKSDVTIIDNWRLEAGSELEFENLKRIIKSGNKGLSDLKEIIDLPNLAVYLAGQFFYANTDWPFNNLKIYLTGKNKIRKWKFAFFDLDYGFGYTGLESVNSNMFLYISERQDLFSRMVNILLKDEEFRELFSKQFQILLNDVFTKKKLIREIDELESVFEDAMKDHVLRWRYPNSWADWKNEVQILREFASKRPEIVQQHLNNFMKHASSNQK